MYIHCRENKKTEQAKETKSHTYSLNYHIQSPLRLGSYMLFLQNILSLRFLNHQGNANQNHNEMSPHISQNGYYQKDKR